jgi:hypothetical protein
MIDPGVFGVNARHHAAPPYSFVGQLRTDLLAMLIADPRDAILSDPYRSHLCFFNSNCVSSTACASEPPKHRHTLPVPAHHPSSRKGGLQYGRRTTNFLQAAPLPNQPHRCARTRPNAHLFSALTGGPGLCRLHQGLSFYKHVRPDKRDHVLLMTCRIVADLTGERKEPFKFAENPTEYLSFFRRDYEHSLRLR